MKDMHDPSDMTASVLDLNEIEKLAGIVEGRVVEWGTTTVVLLRHPSGFTATGTTTARPGHAEDADRAMRYARDRALGALSTFMARQRTVAKQ